jgi:orotate phosphoribosyltransferase
LLQECAVEEGTLGEELDEEGVQVESILRETNALLTGHFKLTSGRHSNAYIEKIRIINNPGQVVRLCAMLAERFRGVPCDVVVGPAMGGVVLAYEVARALGRNFVFTQRYDGVMGIRGGFPLEPVCARW